jgi:disulfide bond formation protein DsbB
VTDLSKARLLALILPSALMLGALGSQFIGGLYPCEMCQWQRWPHEVAIGLALLAFVIRGSTAQRGIVALAALAILVSGAIGVFHAGVEYKWWEGFTECTLPPGVGEGNFMDNIMKSPLIRCDEAQWNLFGVSLAGFNGLISIGGAFAILNLLRRKST